MVSKLAATVLAALGLAVPAAHAPKSAQSESNQSKSNAAHSSQRQALPAIFVVGHGWGHGVGLAQYGAYGYALHGWSYDEIVGHYFPGTTLGDTQKKSVRVLLAPAARRVAVSSKSPFWLRDGAGKKRKLAAGSYAFGPGLKIKLKPMKPARKVRAPLLFSPGASPLAFGGRGYRGALRVKPAGRGLQVVNVVALDSYLRGVVPSEMPNRWPAEALAAQAVVARTYALAHLHGGDFDVYSDTRSQVYGGIAAEAASSDDAVAETAGQVVLYDGELADTFFFSSSGGRTANVQDVWGGDPVPYLVSVSDPYDTLSPYHNWGPLRFGATLLSRKLKVPGKIADFRANVAPSGRVRTLTLVGTRGQRTVTGAAVRSALGLRSTWFRLGLLSLTAQTKTVAYGAAGRLAGVARGTSGVTLEERPYGGSWRSAGRVTVANGAVTVTVHPRQTTDYRLQSGGFRSGVARVSVSPTVDLTAGTDFTSVRGQVHPVLAAAAVEIQRLDGSTWVTVASTTTDSNGAFAATLNLSPGSYRARVTAGHGWAVGVSETIVVVAP
jgi:stage II sporulation protein D